MPAETFQFSILSSSDRMTVSLLEQPSLQGDSNAC